MKLVLKRFSQEADLVDPSNVKYFLVFEVEGQGREIRLPVLSTTAEALVAEIYAKPQEPKVLPQVQAFISVDGSIDDGDIHDQEEPEWPEEEVEVLDENGIPSL